MSESKRVILRTPRGIEYDAFPSTSDLNACCGCGCGIDAGEPMVVCADCGGQFCRACVEGGTFDEHVCDDGDYEDECD